jgi:hypothetical protein
MTTRTRQSSKVLLLIMLVCLPLACESTGTSAVRRERHLNLKTVLPADWEYVDSFRLDANADGTVEWLVAYRFDLLPEREQVRRPIGAFVYQLDGKSPRNIQAHPLRPLNGDYLCECTCVPKMEDLLSGLNGSELTVSDECEDRITRLSIFHRDAATAEYVAKGHFIGANIEYDQQKVSVDRPWLSRAQIAMRETYYPCGNQTYYGAECRTQELVFTDGEPKDVCCSPYPEKAVLAFYMHYDDKQKQKGFLGEEGWKNVEKCETGLCGCDAPREEIEHVWVTSLVVKKETNTANPSHAPDEAVVEVEVICEPYDDSKKHKVTVRWELVRQADRWMLISAEQKDAD